MPHLNFRGMEKQILIDHSKELVDGLTEIVKCDRTWFTIEHTETEYIFDGKIVPGYIFVEVDWFDRGQRVRDLVAEFLTKFCKKYNDNQDTTIIFHHLDDKSYYDNGEHF